ncbi:hypothetical protein PDG61_28215 [Mycolicibacterium sp. BiH015]|uniref:hypothetical protein n=1 Tax=Mycolicibacterium sp. BiH015 TaxID=3018808 RepID=UPI0022E0956E|nr:hypothetical protein [Mycolicibacterium sp. BiH015]MDA2894827.1 hypothetical protein [Mycolicibacterium sp. BiH015]
MRNLTASAVAAGVCATAVALAAPAHADLAPGLYEYRSVMATGATEDISMRVDSCGPGCISLFNLENNRDQGQARIQGAQYVLDQFVPGGAFCPDGRAVDVLARYTFNLDGTNGLYTLNGPNPCGNNGPVGSTTFVLVPA